MTKREGLHEFLLRVPEPLWEQFVRQAKNEERTATQQLIWLIRQSLQKKPRTRRGK